MMNELSEFKNILIVLLFLLTIYQRFRIGALRNKLEQEGRFRESVIEAFHHIAEYD
jgi:hypothetical protein